MISPAHWFVGVLNDFIWSYLLLHNVHCLLLIVSVCGSSVSQHRSVGVKPLWNAWVECITMSSLQALPCTCAMVWSATGTTGLRHCVLPMSHWSLLTTSWQQGAVSLLTTSWQQGAVPTLNKWFWRTGGQIVWKPVSAAIVGNHRLPLAVWLSFA